MYFYFTIIRWPPTLYPTIGTNGRKRFIKINWRGRGIIIGEYCNFFLFPFSLFSYLLTKMKNKFSWIRIDYNNSLVRRRNSMTIIFLPKYESSLVHLYIYTSTMKTLKNIANFLSIEFLSAFKIFRYIYHFVK